MSTNPNIGNYSPGFVSREVMGYANRNFTDAGSTFAPRVESIYAQTRLLEEERLSLTFPKFSLYNLLVSPISGKGEKVVRVPTAVGVPRIHPIYNTIKNVYRTGSGTDGDTAPAFSIDTGTTQFWQTKAGAEFTTPFASMDYIGTAKPAFTAFALEGALQTPTFGEAEITAGDLVGCNVFMTAESRRYAKDYMKILQEFSANGKEALEFHRNTAVLFTILSSGVITSTAGNYGGNESLGRNNQTSGGDGYETISLFTPASITGAYAGLYKATAQLDGIQRAAAGGAMSGTRRIMGRNVPTLVGGAGTGVNGANGPITNDELENLAMYRNRNWRTNLPHTLVVDPFHGIRQIAAIPEVKSRLLNDKALDYNKETDTGIQMVTPHGIMVKSCPSILPMGANSRYTGIFAPNGGKKPVRSLLEEAPHIFNLDLPNYNGPNNQHAAMRIQYREGFGVVQPDLIALLQYLPTAS